MCRDDNPQWDSDTSPLFWDFELSGKDVTVAKDLLYRYGPGDIYEARGTFSALMLRIQPTPHAWPVLIPVQNKFPLPSRGCQNVANRLGCGLEVRICLTDVLGFGAFGFASSSSISSSSSSLFQGAVLKKGGS